MQTQATQPARIAISNRRRGGWWRVLLRLMVGGAAAGVTAGAMAAILVYTALAHDLPRLDRFDKMAGVGVTRFEAADGSLVGERYTERRMALSWEEMPRPLILAFLAAEDARFFEHSGIDFRGIVRAMVTNVFAGGVKEGASTITQQLAKILVGSDRNWSRKVKEAILARRMEDLYSKPQILAWYINVIYFGHRSYGVQAAAQNYFRKNAWELTLGEMTLLAACAQSPSRVNPALDLAGTKARAAHILKNMADLGWATPEAVSAAKAETFVVYPLRDLWGDQTPDFTEIVRRIGERWSDGTRSFLERGLTIRMAVDPAAQRAAHDALDTGLVGLQKKQGYPGPLAHVAADGRDAFFAKNAKWVARAQDGGGPEGTISGVPRVGSRLLGRVAEVSDKDARVELTAELSGSFELKASAWATPWTVFPNDGTKRDTSGRVSFNGKLKALSDAVAVGDVVLVRVVAAPAPPKPKKPAKPKKGKKGAPIEEPVVEVAAPVLDARTNIRFELEPVPMMQGVIVSTSLAGDGIDALATGWDFDRSEIDRSLSVRPTGSNMKPIAYALAYDKGLPPSAPLSADDFKEGGFSIKGANQAWMSPWDGLIASNNLISLRVFVSALERVKPGDWQRWGETLGLDPCRPNPDPNGGEPICPLKAFYDGDKHNYLAEVMGASQRPRGMLSAFATFAREGRRPTLDLVRKVMDKDGRILERHYAPVDPWASVGDAFIALYDNVANPEVPVIQPSTAHIIAKNLAAAVKSGTGTRAGTIGREAAGKTGTLDYDVWFSGFTGDRATVAWIGADNNERTLGPSKSDNLFYGSNAAIMWADFMRTVDQVAKNDKRRGIAEIVPRDVVTVLIDPPTGLVARVDGVPIPHRVGTEPTETVPEPVVDDTTF